MVLKCLLLAIAIFSWGCGGDSETTVHTTGHTDLALNGTGYVGFELQAGAADCPFLKTCSGAEFESASIVSFEVEDEEILTVSEETGQLRVVGNQIGETVVHVVLTDTIGEQFKEEVFVTVSEPSTLEILDSSKCVERDETLYRQIDFVLTDDNEQQLFAFNYNPFETITDVVFTRSDGYFRYNRLLVSTDLVQVESKTPIYIGPEEFEPCEVSQF